MMEDKTVLSEADIEQALSHLEGWEYVASDKTLQRVWYFDKFVPTMAFVRRLTGVMDDQNHHSDLALDSRAKTLTVRVSTHSKDAVTRADLSFAEAVSAAE